MVGNVFVIGVDCDYFVVIECWNFGQDLGYGLVWVEYDSLVFLVEEIILYYGLFLGQQVGGCYMQVVCSLEDCWVFYFDLEIFIVFVGYVVVCQVKFFVLLVNLVGGCEVCRFK